MSDPVDVHFRFEGRPEGPVLVLSHGLGLSMAMWDPQMGRLASAFRVLRYDHRGHGSSPVPPGAYTIEDLGRDLVRLLDRLALEKVHYCGLSLGGMVGMWLAANEPDRVDHLVLCCTAARMPQPEIYAARAARVRREGLLPIADAVISRWFTPAFLNNERETVDRIRRLFLSTSPHGYASTCDALAVMDLRDQLPRIKAQTLVVAGAGDQATPLQQAREIVRMIGGAKLGIIDDAAHLANLEQVDRFTGVMLSGLGE